MRFGIVRSAVLLAIAICPQIGTSALAQCVCFPGSSLEVRLQAVYESSGSPAISLESARAFAAAAGSSIVEKRIFCGGSWVEFWSAHAESQTSVYPPTIPVRAWAQSFMYEPNQGEIWATAAAECPALVASQSDIPSEYRTAEVMAEWGITPALSPSLETSPCTDECVFPRGMAGSVSSAAVRFDADTPIGWLLQVKVKQNICSGSYQNASIRRLFFRIAFQFSNSQSTNYVFCASHSHGTQVASEVMQWDENQQVWRLAPVAVLAQGAVGADVELAVGPDGAFDFDGDGRFNANDVESLALLLGMSGPAGLNWDIDGDGVVSARDIEFFGAMIEGGFGSGLFGDADGDGVCDCSDSSGIVAALGTSHSDPAYNVRIDRDLDGFVSFQEWRSAFRLASPADVTYDGFVTGDDFDLFLLSFLANDAVADVDDDGVVTGVDFDVFVMAFFSYAC